MSTIPTHPYYPLHLSLPHYAENTSNLLTVLLYFVLGFSVVVVSALALAQKRNPNLCSTDRFLVLWFAVSGSLHLVFEGYFILHSAELAGSQAILAQLWKEYAQSDSRYLAEDTFVLSVESFTVAVIGPLSLLTSYLTMTSTSPYTLLLQVLVSWSHIYSDTLYYLTSVIDASKKGIEHSRPEPLYFWVYFVGMNAFWIVIPGWILYRSLTRIADTLARESSRSKRKDA